MEIRDVTMDEKTERLKPIKKHELLHWLRLAIILFTKYHPLFFLPFIFIIIVAWVLTILGICVTSNKDFWFFFASICGLAVPLIYLIVYTYIIYSVHSNKGYKRQEKNFKFLCYAAIFIILSSIVFLALRYYLNQFSFYVGHSLLILLFLFIHCSSHQITKGNTLRGIIQFLSPLACGLSTLISIHELYRTICNSISIHIWRSDVHIAFNCISIALIVLIFAFIHAKKYDKCTNWNPYENIKIYITEKSFLSALLLMLFGCVIYTMRDNRLQITTIVLLLFVLASGGYSIHIFRFSANEIIAKEIVRQKIKPKIIAWGINKHPGLSCLNDITTTSPSTYSEDIIIHYITHYASVMACIYQQILNQGNPTDQTNHIFTLAKTIVQDIHGFLNKKEYDILYTMGFIFGYAFVLETREQQILAAPSNKYIYLQNHLAKAIEKAKSKSNTEKDKVADDTEKDIDINDTEKGIDINDTEIVKDDTKDISGFDEYFLDFVDGGLKISIWTRFSDKQALEKINTFIQTSRSSPQIASFYNRLKEAKLTNDFKSPTPLSIKWVEEIRKMIPSAVPTPSQQRRNENGK